MDNQKKYRLIAGAVAVLLFAGMLLWLIFTRLSFVPPDGSESVSYTHLRAHET